MRSHFLLLAPLLALVPFACTTTGDGTSAGNSRGTGGETTGTASTSSSSLATGSGGASSGSDSSGTKSTGSNTTGTNSSGTNSTGSGGASSGSNSTGSNSTGSNSTGSNSTGSNSTGIGGASSGSNSTGSNSTGSNSTGTNSTGIGGASSGSNSTGSDSTGMGGASTGTNSTGTEGGGGCAGYVDVKAPNNAQQHFTSACEGAWGLNETMRALGYHMSGGAPPGVDELDLQGCTSVNPGSPGVYFTAQNASMPGTFAAGSITYIDNNGGTWVNTTDPYQVVITQLDMPGGVIEGSFSAMVIGPMDTKLPISGTFHVCRVSDLELP